MAVFDLGRVGRLSVVPPVTLDRSHLLKPTGALALWEQSHPFDREAYIQPLLAFHVRNKRRHGDNDDGPVWRLSR